MTSKETNKLRTQTAKEIMNNHTRNCAHQFVMVADLKEWLTQKLKEPKPSYPLNSQAKSFYDAKEVILLELLEDLK